MFSLRSTTAESRLYIGASHAEFKAKASKPVPFVIDTTGHYQVSLTGFDSTAAKAKSMLKSNVLLDTGASVTMIASADAMSSLLHSLNALCRPDSPWTAVAATLSNTPRDGQYRQYVCDPTSD